LPDDALEMVAAKVGSDLGRFACVSRGMNEVAKPAIWRKAYQVARALGPTPRKLHTLTPHPPDPGAGQVL
jgi:hypothetical protein